MSSSRSGPMAPRATDPPASPRAQPAPAGARETQLRHERCPVRLALLVANTINAGVDIGAIAAGINLLVPGLPIPLLVLPVTLAIVALQVWGSYRLIAGTFKWLTLALFAYIGSALFARPDL